jgi:hypothetical protein
MGESVPVSLDTSLVRLSEGGTFRVTLTPVGANRIEARTWRLAVATPDGSAVHHASVIVGGGMPLHGHGMETDPVVTQSPTAGEYRLENVRLGAMGGGRQTWWEIRVLIRAGVTEDLAIFNIVTPGRPR